MTTANRVLRNGKRHGYLGGNHGSIGGSWPIAISGYPRHLSKFVKHFFVGLDDAITEYPQPFHNVFPIATIAPSGEPRFTSAVRYVFSS